ncbi:hypothetical protein NON00_03945 [Roseomonas sp. GC11]|uniref:oxidoreductase n=1 Tax=Roseomonas sp. GC11 TaxID=2950546 RepID=UPI00210E58A7|nr:hypothetical protein [Roseomonas sp. GC11]MCQ4159076.1 hypothetical protein [Roseomonas sp. GC11]
MTRSRPVTLDGQFVGILLHSDGCWRFLARDPRSLAADGLTFANPAEAERLLRALLRGRPATRPSPSSSLVEFPAMHGIDLSRQPLTAGTLALANRMVVSPSPLGGQRHGGLPHPRSAAHYAAQAGAGLVITERCWISPQGAGRAFSPGIRTAAQEESWREITRHVHAHGELGGGARTGRIALRLWHAGRLSHSAVQPGGSWPVAPSPLAGEGTLPTPLGQRPLPRPRALSLDEIPVVIEDFARALRRARAAGFDAVELDSSGHGLIEQFLDPASNHREDDYGGTPEGRLRFLAEILAALVAAWEPGRIGLRVALRQPLDEAAPGLALRAARLAEAYGLAWLHITHVAAPARDLPLLRKAYGGALLLGRGEGGEAAALAALRLGQVDLAALPALPHPALLLPPPQDPAPDQQLDIASPTRPALLAPLPLF